MRLTSVFRDFALIGRGLIALAATSVAITPALAQDRESWRCSATNGTFSANPQALSPGIRTLAGRIQFNEGYFGDRWHPVAHVVFTDPGAPRNAPCSCSGLMAEIYPNQPDIVKFYLIANGHSTGVAQAKVGIPITFALTLDRVGRLTATIGRSTPVSQTATLQRPTHGSARMSCSSGDVSFLNMEAY